MLFVLLAEGARRRRRTRILYKHGCRGRAREACQALADLDDFGKLPADLVEAAPRFREWYNHATPESEKLPLDWSQLDRPDKAFKKMLVVRSLRPDRMVSHLANFLRTTMPAGGDYVDCDSTLNSVQILSNLSADSTPQTPDLLHFVAGRGRRGRSR